MKQPLVRFDWAMKKLLRSKANFGILEGFLSELLKRDLKIMELLESESNKEDENDKYNKIAVLVKLDDEIVLVEIQSNVGDDYFHRMLFGASEVVTQYLKKERPCNINKVYIVSILYSDDLNSSDYIYRSTASFIGMNSHNQLILTKKQNLPYQYPEYHLIKVNQFNNVIRDTLDEWVYFFKNTEVNDNFSAKGLLEVKEKLNFSALSELEKQEYNNYI